MIDSLSKNLIKSAYDLKIRKPDFFLDCAKSENSAANCMGNIIIYFDKLLLRIKPEAILVLGDTNSIT